MSILLMILGVGFAAPSITYIEPEFRAEPMWYWPNPSTKKCVGMPTFDIISRTGPKAIRAKNIDKDVECGIDLDGRLIEARLQCGKELIGIYYSKESLCKESLKK